MPLEREEKFDRSAYNIEARLTGRYRTSVLSLYAERAIVCFHLWMHNYTERVYWQFTETIPFIAHSLYERLTGA
jgi:hypothetical protein